MSQKQYTHHLLYLVVCDVENQISKIVLGEHRIFTSGGSPERGFCD